MLIIDEYGVCVLEEWLKRDGMMVGVSVLIVLIK